MINSKVCRMKHALYPGRAFYHRSRSRKPEGSDPGYMSSESLGSIHSPRTFNRIQIKPVVFELRIDILSLSFYCLVVLSSSETIARLP